MAPAQTPYKQSRIKGRNGPSCIDLILCTFYAVYRRKPCQIRAEGPGSRTGRPKKAGEGSQGAEQGEQKALGSH